AMAEPLVSQRDQPRSRPPDPRGALAPRPEVLAGAPAYLGREPEGRWRLSEPRYAEGAVRRPVHRLDHVDGLGRAPRSAGPGIPGRGGGEVGRQRPGLAEDLRPRWRRPPPGRFALVDRHGVSAVVLLLLRLQVLEGFPAARAAGPPRAGGPHCLQLR